MPKASLVERMEKKGAPKAWIREVNTKDDRIERLLEIKETYLNIIDKLAKQVEDLTPDPCENCVLEEPDACEFCDVDLGE